MRELKIGNRKIGWVWLVAGLVIILLVGWFLVRWWNRDVVSIKVATITKGSIEAVVSASGVVDAPVYELGPKLGGKIITLNVSEGQSVKKGMTLAEFDDTTRIVAPADGVVAKINYDEGETVVPGSSAVVVVNYNKSWIEAQIDEIDIAHVKVGDQAEITSDVYPDKTFQGEIYWIAPLAELRKVGGRVKMDEESYVFPCKIRLLGKHRELKVNMSVNADVITKRNDQALVVPREAIISKDDSSLVFKIKRNRVWESKITIGIRSYTSVEALGGVEEGDQVAITEVAKLKNKGRVKIVK